MTAITARAEQLQDVHRQGVTGCCRECGTGWPCDTWQLAAYCRRLAAERAES